MKVNLYDLIVNNNFVKIGNMEKFVELFGLFQWIKQMDI